MPAEVSIYTGVDDEGALTGTAREEAVRAVRMMTAKEKKRIVGLAWRAKGGFLEWTASCGTSLGFLYSFGQQQRQTFNTLTFPMRGKSRTKQPSCCHSETKWCATLRHTPGLPSGQQSVSQLSSGMRAISFSGRFHLIHFVLFALTLVLQSEIHAGWGSPLDLDWL